MQIFNHYKKNWKEPLSGKVIRKQVAHFARQNISYEKDRIIGFPGTNPEPISVEIYCRYLSLHSNNIGLHTNRSAKDREVGFGGTQEAENEVIAMAADILDAKPCEVDGYISPGGTEANIVGCWIGRNAHPNKSSAIICSHLAHYSISKAANILGIGIKAERDGSGLHILGTDVSGHILLDLFEKKLEELAKKKVFNIIIIGNAGTTMLGSIDNIPAMSEIIEKIRKRFLKSNFHFHIDAAFGGFVIPFLDNLPKIGFSNKNVDSVTIDVHKMGFAPYGSGMILARRGLFEHVKSFAPYIPGNDYTLCGSRSGAMALSCWAAMRKIGKKGYAQYAKKFFRTTQEIQTKLKKSDLETFPSDINIIAVKGKFPKILGNTFITHIHNNFPVDLANPNLSLTHPIWNIVVMPHTKIKVINELVAKLKDNK